MDFKDAAVRAVVAQYNNLDSILDDFPSEDAVSDVVNAVQESVDISISVDSEDPDTSVEYTTEFDIRNTCVRSLEQQLSSANTKLDEMKDQCVEILLEYAASDWARASQEGWAWKNEPEDTTMWSAEEWFAPFKEIDAPEVFWKEMIKGFAPTSNYVERMFANNAVLHRNSVIKSLIEIMSSSTPTLYGSAWLQTFVEHVSKDKGKNVSYQKVIDSFKSTWTVNAVKYATSGKPEHKDRCQQLEQYGLSPVPKSVDLSALFVPQTSDDSLREYLQRLCDITGMKDMLTIPQDPLPKTYGLSYLASSDAVSLTTLCQTLADNPKTADKVAVVQKFALEQQVSAPTQTRVNRKI